MRAIRLSLSSAASTVPIPMDQYLDPFNVGLSVDLSAGASLTYTVEHTFQNVYDPAFDPATAVWYPNTGLSAKTASTDGNYSFPVSAIRLRVSVYASGTATLNVLQAGIAGN